MMIHCSNGPWKGGHDSNLYCKCQVNYTCQFHCIFSHIAQMESSEDRKEIFVKSSLELSLPPHLIIPSSSIKLTEIIGQGIIIFLTIIIIIMCGDIMYMSLYYILGEFGIVYKGYIKNSDLYSIEEYLAIKTLKGIIIIISCISFP